MDLNLREAYLYLKLFFASISKWAIGTFHALYLDLDTIKDCDSFKDVQTVQQKVKSTSSLSSRTNIYYLFPLLAFSLTHLDSLAILAQVNFQYKFESGQNLVSRKISPNELWFQGDITFNSGWLIAWSVFLLLLSKPGLAQKFHIYAIGGDRLRIYSNGNFWNKDCVDKILNLRKRARKIYTSSLGYPGGIVFAALYWTWNAYQNYTRTWRDIVIIAYMPVLSVNGNFGIFCIVFFITLTIRYFQIRQEALLSHLKLITRELSKKQSKRSNAYVNSIWQRFCALNQDILLFNAELSAYSAYWCPFMSVIFVGYIGLDTLLLYGMLVQTGHVNSFHRSFFVFFQVECLALLLMITHECTTIVRNNVAIFKTNCEFCYTFTKLGQHNVVRLLQLSKMVSNHRGAKNGFRLLNGFMIDSKMFEIIFFYMCTIYMALLDKEKSK